jgi:hypothetical protein
MPHRILTALFLTLPALQAATINTSGECPSSITFAASITYNIPAGAGCNEGGTITVAQTQFSESISTNVTVGENFGGFNVLANIASPVYTVPGAIGGMSELTITYTDSVNLGTLWEAEGASGYIGQQLTWNTACNNYCGFTKSTTYSVGMLVENGEQLSLIDVPMYLTAGMSQANLSATVSVTAAVTVADAWAAQPQSVPEPSAFWPGMALLAAAVAWKGLGRIA